MARVGVDLVLCADTLSWDVGWSDRRDETPQRVDCFTLHADGGVSARPFEPLPGIAFSYEGPSMRGVSDPQHLLFESNGLTSIELLDGLRPPRLVSERRVPRGPCEPAHDGDEWTAETGACGDYLARHYVPYDRSLIVVDADRLVGFLPARHEVFVLDAATFEERTRTRVRMCPHEPDTQDKLEK